MELTLQETWKSGQLLLFMKNDVLNRRPLLDSICNSIFETSLTHEHRIEAKSVVGIDNECCSASPRPSSFTFSSLSKRYFSKHLAMFDSYAENAGAAIPQPDFRRLDTNPGRDPGEGSWPRARGISCFEKPWRF
jgi:hypothetical protein